MFYLGIIVLLPLAALVAEAAGLGFRGIWRGRNRDQGARGASSEFRTGFCGRHR